MSQLKAPTVERGKAFGKSLRREVPRSSHGDWSAAADRPDAVEVITSQNESRLSFLVPIRHWRMSQTPFSFYRGGAKLMAEDLSTTPTSGLQVQLCGDAHLSNFGVYGSPERELVFDLNDFDETLPGPWEWDVKRLAGSFAIAARHNGYDSDDETMLAAAAARAYRRAMDQFAEAGYLDVWYSHLSFDDIRQVFGDQLTKKQRKSSDKFARKARSKDSDHTLRKLAEETDDGYRIMSQPPLIMPIRDLPTESEPEQLGAWIEREFDAYLDTVADHLRVLIRRFRFQDMALKVVGVGSVGTRCAVVLLEGRGADDPFFLQIKEAGPSVLEGHLPASAYTQQGERVVVGQRLMQATSDSFLGWHTGRSGSHYYWRQFKDMKGSAEVEGADVESMERYAALCGWTLARAHARSGDPEAIAGYLGSGDGFDQAVAVFSTSYADQNELDYAAFKEAIASGRIEAHE